MKFKLLSLIALFCWSLPSFAQQKPMEQIDKDGVYFYVDQMPGFPGGQEAMQRYLQANVRYPVKAQKKGVSGRVLIQFVVREDGTLSDFKIVRPVHSDLDAEALRVVQSMPKWTPGVEKGKAVPVRYTIPISFNLTAGTGNSIAPSDVRLPKGTEIKNKDLTGVWQSCIIGQSEEEYAIAFTPMLKIFSSDKTFMNILTGNPKTGATLFARGEFTVKSDTTYVENLSESIMTSFGSGSQNTITVNFLHDDLVKFTFMVPGRDKPWTECWYRIKMAKSIQYAGN